MAAERLSIRLTEGGAKQEDSPSRGRANRLTHRRFSTVATLACFALKKDPGDAIAFPLIRL